VGHVVTRRDVTGYIRMRRSDAIALAKAERDSLRLRARSATACRPAWRRAVKNADAALAALVCGHDEAATEALYHLARSWRAAYRCQS